MAGLAGDMIPTIRNITASFCGGYRRSNDSIQVNLFGLDFRLQGLIEGEMAAGSKNNHPNGKLGLPIAIRRFPVRMSQRKNQTQELSARLFPHQSAFSIAFKTAFSKEALWPA